MPQCYIIGTFPFLFLLGVVKYLVHCRKPTMLKELTHLIEDTFNDISDNRQLCDTYAHVQKDRPCVNVGGRYFENYP
jgi:hypothetical protein